VIDFTSALYLGIEHSSSSLPAWSRLTLGKPAALETIKGSRRVETELARLLGCENAVLAPSTLHAFHDVFAVFAGGRGRILLHEDVYPIARVAAGCGARSIPEDLRVPEGAVIVADGFLPFRGSSPPLAHYSSVAHDSGGLLVIDDTQAVGLLGPEGGGTVRDKGMADQHVLVVASLAKAFGVPITVIGGSWTVIRRLKDESFARVHCSPPSAAVIAAAERAVAINNRSGSALRSKLAANTGRLRQWLAMLQFPTTNGNFPVQALGCISETAVTALHTFLLNRGVRTVLACVCGKVRLVFVLTARHSFAEIDTAGSLVRAWLTDVADESCLRQRITEAPVNEVVR